MCACDFSKLTILIFESNFHNFLKGTVQRQITGVESGTNRYIFLNCLVGHFHFYAAREEPKKLKVLSVIHNI